MMDGKGKGSRTGILLGAVLLAAGCSAALEHRETIENQKVEPFPYAQQIAFTLKRDNNWEVYTIRTDTRAVTRLTHSPLEEEAVAPSADGKQLAFVSRRDGDYEIYVMNLDGSRQQRLTFTQGVDEKPIWVSNSQILFESARDGNWEIYMMDADGLNQRNLTRTPADEADPVLSPEGNRILFKSKRDGAWKLYIMDLSGTNIIPLIASDYQEGALDDPVWSPDGKKIAFVSHRDGNAEIYSMDVLSFLRDEDHSSPENYVGRVTRHPSTDESPVWSPDGEHIIFVSNRDGGRKLYMLDPDGTEVSVLSSVFISEGTPRWSPDSQWVAFVTRNGTGAMIQLINPFDGQHILLESGGQEMAELEWIPLVSNAVQDPA